MSMVSQPQEGVKETTEVDISVRGAVPHPPRHHVAYGRDPEEFEDSAQGSSCRQTKAISRFDPQELDFTRVEPEPTVDTRTQTGT